jgi:hypothetical protein
MDGKLVSGCSIDAVRALCWEKITECDEFISGVRKRFDNTECSNLIVGLQSCLSRMYTLSALELITAEELDSYTGAIEIREAKLEEVIDWRTKQEEHPAQSRG